MLGLTHNKTTEEIDALVATNYQKSEKITHNHQLEIYAVAGKNALKKLGFNWR